MHECNVHFGVLSFYRLLTWDITTKMSDLINLDTKTWNEQLICSLFYDVDVKRIIKISLAVGMTEDFISWNYTKVGLFTIRSRYFLEWDHQYGQNLLRTNQQGTVELNPVWASIWSLRVPAKIKNSLEDSYTAQYRFGKEADYH
jgi:hypothetical protein